MKEDEYSKSKSERNILPEQDYYFGIENSDVIDNHNEKQKKEKLLLLSLNNKLYQNKTLESEKKLSSIRVNNNSITKSLKSSNYILNPNKSKISTKNDFYSSDEILDSINNRYKLDNEKLLNSMKIGLDDKV